VYDGNQIVMQFQKTGTGDLAATDLSHRYLWGPAVDQLLADEQLSPVVGGGYDLTSPGTTVWTLTDNENTVRDLVIYNSGTTTVVNHREFSAYGELLTQTNPSTTPNTVAAVDCVFGFTGRAMSRFSEDSQTGGVTGIQNNGRRWFDAITGRWLSQDPIGFGGGTTNLYGYCDNGPTNATDPRGLLIPHQPPLEPTPKRPPPGQIVPIPLPPGPLPQGPLPPQPPPPVPMPIPPRPWGPWPWWPWYPNWLPPPPRPRIQLTPGGPKKPIPPPPPPPDNQNNLPNRGLTGCPCPWTIA
jgi:RHS repeat-associated protein